VPILKIHDDMQSRPIMSGYKVQEKMTCVQVDLSVENELPVFKSRLLLEYSLIDERFAQLVVLVKAWAKGRGVNSSVHGTLNSFGLSLLVLHYLQVLPEYTLNTASRQPY
jgi:DNA polymerase sigma